MPTSYMAEAAHAIQPADLDAAAAKIAHPMMSTARHSIDFG